MSTVTSSNKSRWGYHSVDYPTFVKLKKLHKLYWQTVRDFCRWQRWARKLPENRVGPEPTYSKVFFQPRYPKSTYPQLWHWSACISDRGVLAAYQNARTPRATEAEVVPSNLWANAIDSLLAEVEA